MAEFTSAEKVNIGYENEYSTDAMTGGPDKRRQLYYQLIQSMKKAESVDIIVSFLMKQKYNEIYHLYGEISEEKNINPKLVITEDSNSGFEFFKEMSRQKGVNCFSAGGKSNIIRQLEAAFRLSE